MLIHSIFLKELIPDNNLEYMRYEGQVKLEYAGYPLHCYTIMNDPDHWDTIQLELDHPVHLWLDGYAPCHQVFPGCTDITQIEKGCYQVSGKIIELDRDELVLQATFMLDIETSFYPNRQDLRDLFKIGDWVTIEGCMRIDFDPDYEDVSPHLQQVSQV